MRKKLITTLAILIAMGAGSQYTAFAADPRSDKKLMENARLAYEKGKLDHALELYEKVPQSSDFWIEALEEKAWTHLRKGENDRALALVTTITSDLLSPQVGPEPYFLKSLIEYRLCNIRGVFETFELFKKRYRSRQESLEKLKATNSNESAAKALEILMANKAKVASLKADDFGMNVQYLPRYFYRDLTIQAAASTGSESRITQRLSQLAEDDIKEIDLTLQKMHLLESQVVQQVFAYNKQLQEKRSAEFTPHDRNVLVFPHKGKGDLWLDEIDNFEAATADCPINPLKGGSQ